MAADHNGMQDWAAAYDREGQERVVNNNGIRHHTEKTMLFLAGVTHFFVVSRYNNMLFWWGLYNFLCVGVLLTKEKVVHTTLCTTYIEKNNKTHPQHHVFGGECFSSSVGMYAFLC